jgi:hypothetical protein
MTMTRRALGTALAFALLVPASPAAATTAGQLMNACAPPGGQPTQACYAYVQGVMDDANLVGADVDRRIVDDFGLFCPPAGARIDEAGVAAVVRAIRADPSMSQHSAAIAVRLALPKVYRCTPQMLRRPAAQRPPR